MTSQINFRTSSIPNSNSFMENYPISNYHHSFSKNTLSSYPRFDHSKLSHHCPSLRENKVTLFELNSMMESFLRERQILFRTALSKKLFIRHYEKYGMEEINFTEAEGNVNDLVWEYGSMFSNFIGGYSHSKH